MQVIRIAWASVAEPDHNRVRAERLLRNGTATSGINGRQSTEARRANLEAGCVIWQTGRPAGKAGIQGSRGQVMSLSADEVAKVAILARLRLAPDELATFTGQLNAIVDYVTQLQELNTEGVEPLAHGVEVRNVFREDVRGPSLDREAALANAPKRNAESFLVPAVLE
jgi:aspartyl-tRNA(Asn)/glutamyl-tRNA(Gln) amidotransferase subunit C